MVFCVVILLICQPLLLNGFDVDSVKESCFEIKSTVFIDDALMEPVVNYYYPLMSRFDLYFTVLGLIGKNAKDLQEDEIYNQSCITVSGTEDGIIDKGFNGKEKYHSLRSVKGWEVYEWFSYDDGGFKNATCYNTLTDNKTFSFCACCTNDGYMTWGVVSSQQKLPQQVVKQIHDHAVSLGFKREYFTALRYDSCTFSSSALTSSWRSNYNLLCGFLFVYAVKLYLS